MSLTAALCSGCLSAPEEHLVPAGYVGDVFIVVGEARGVPPRRDGFTRVYEIPSSGLLVTQDDMSPRWHSSKFFYVASDGSRIPIPVESSSIADTPENRADVRPLVWFERDVYQGIPCAVQYRHYYVGTRSDLLSRPPNKDEERLLRLLKDSYPCP
jgi:hypothetical protein